MYDCLERGAVAKWQWTRPTRCITFTFITMLTKLMRQRNCGTKADILVINMIIESFKDPVNCADNNMWHKMKTLTISTWSHEAHPGSALGDPHLKISRSKSIMLNRHRLPDRFKTCMHYIWSIILILMTRGSAYYRKCVWRV